MELKKNKHLKERNGNRGKKSGQLGDYNSK